MDNQGLLHLQLCCFIPFSQRGKKAYNKNESASLARSIDFGLNELWWHVVGKTKLLEVNAGRLLVLDLDCAQRS